MGTTGQPGACSDLRRTPPRIGGWSILGGRVVVEALCRAPVDFVGIDAQHGFFAFDEAAVAVQIANLCGTRVLVRVPVDQIGWIPRYLDAGADGIVLAMTGSAADAERAVHMSLYQPHGRRSYGGGKRNGVRGPPRPAARRGPQTPRIIPMNATVGALAELTEIVATPGLAGAWIGPVDLGLALGRPHPLPPGDQVWRDALRQVVGSCQDAGIRPGMFAVGGEDAREWLAAGFLDVVLSSDIALLRRAFHRQIARPRAPVTDADPICAVQSADPYAGR